MAELLFWNNITGDFGVFQILFLYSLGENVLLYTLLLNCPQFAIQRVKRVGTKSRRMIYWQKIVTRGRSLPRRDIVPSRRAKGEKQWPWRDDMPAQCHHCRNNKGCCWATRIRGHGNRGALNYPESIMLLLPNRNAPPTTVLSSNVPLTSRPHPYSHVCSAIILFSASRYPPMWLSTENINMWLTAAALCKCELTEKFTPFIAIL